MSLGVWISADMKCSKQCMLAFNNKVSNKSSNVLSGRIIRTFSGGRTLKWHGGYAARACNADLGAEPQAI